MNSVEATHILAERSSIDIQGLAGRLAEHVSKYKWASSGGLSIEDRCHLLNNIDVLAAALIKELAIEKAWTCELMGISDV